MKRAYKCAYRCCKHGGEVDKDHAVKVSTRYYHPDCLKEKQTIQAIVDLYHEKVDLHPIETHLWRVVNDLVFNQDIDAEFFLFAFQYCLNAKWTLHSPSGLRYVVKDENAKKAWNNKLNAEFLRKMKSEEENREVAELDLPEVEEKQTGKKKVTKILGV